MEFIKSPAHSLRAHLPEKLREPVMTIGNFDGVHRGHRKLLTLVVKRGKALGLPSAAMTFDPHPQKVIMGAPGLALRGARGPWPPLLLPLEERVKRMGETGVEYIVCIEFSREFARLSPSDFVLGVLKESLNPREVYVGPNFSFGEGARGGLKELRSLGGQYGFTVKGISPERVGKEAVSSTRVRHLLQEGEVRKANRLLGYPYYLIGVVVTGTGRGRTLNFPTANIQTRWELLPRDGVYGVRVWVRGRPCAGALNLGTRPTFREKHRIPEVFLLDFSDDIYGETVKVEFVERIRDERAFPDIGSLEAQIAEDVRKVRKLGLWRQSPKGTVP